jgi:uncharacterized membrane protein YGL010W
MRKIDQLLEQYGACHQNPINKLIHWVCVPLIMLSLTGMILQIPFPMDLPGLNWAVLIFAIALIYYLRLSPVLFAGFVLITAILILAADWISNQAAVFAISPLVIFISIFTISWIGQFYGHHIEGKKPSFLQDLQFLLIGPAWLLHFIYKKFGIRY